MRPVHRKPLIRLPRRSTALEALRRGDVKLPDEPSTCKYKDCDILQDEKNTSLRWDGRSQYVKFYRMCKKHTNEYYGGGISVSAIKFWAYKINICRLSTREFASKILKLTNRDAIEAYVDDNVRLTVRQLMVLYVIQMKQCACCRRPIHDRMVDNQDSRLPATVNRIDGSNRMFDIGNSRLTCGVCTKARNKYTISDIEEFRHMLRTHAPPDQDTRINLRWDSLEAINQLYKVIKFDQSTRPAIRKGIFSKMNKTASDKARIRSMAKRAEIKRNNTRRYRPDLLPVPEQHGSPPETVGGDGGEKKASEGGEVLELGIPTMMSFAAVQGLRCPYTNIPMQKTGSLIQMSPDRIDGRQGYDINNVQLVLLAVNYAKGECGDNPEELQQWLSAMRSDSPSFWHNNFFDGDHRDDDGDETHITETN